MADTGGASDGAQLTFAIENGAGGKSTANVVFITDDAGYNKISLEIQLSTGSATLAPGTIPDPSNPPSTGTTIYIDLSALAMTPEVWTKIAVSDPSWDYKTFADEQVIGLTPKVSVLIGGAAGAAAVPIDGIEVTSTGGSAQKQLYGQFSNVPGVSGEYSSFSVALQNPPSADKPLGEAIAFALSKQGIVNSPTANLAAANAFGLQLLGQPGEQATATADTVFTVGFVYGEPRDSYGYGALTTRAAATQIGAEKGLNADGWKVTPSTGLENPIWTLKPPAGQPIVGAGVDAVVEIDFSNIVTHYQPGPTVMLISWTGVQGYADGAAALVLQKVAHAQITSLQVLPNPSVFSGGEAEVTVSWTVEGNPELLLTQNFVTKPVTGTSQRIATLDAEQTTFQLQATGDPGTVPNVDFATVVATALPKVNSFIGGPTEIYSGQYGQQASFYWTVDSVQGVLLSSTGGAFSGQGYGATGNASVSLNGPQMITMAPVTVSEQDALSRRLVVSAFTPSPAGYSGVAGKAVAASPTGPFLLMGGANGLTAYDTAQYNALGSVPTGHAATALAFSADGSVVAVANADSTISFVPVTEGPDGTPQFGTVATVQVPGAPQAMVFSPDAQKLFATIPGVSGQAGTVVSLVSQDGQFGVADEATVGAAPSGLTLDAAGSRLFVANSGDDTVSMIGITEHGGLGNVTSHNVVGGPTGIAATPDGKQLLVTCAKAGTVVAIDPNHFDTAARATVTVGASPGPIVLLPSGAYAFIGSTGGGTLSLIGCGGSLSSVAMLGSHIAIGGSITDLAVTPEGLQVLAATSDGLSAVALATYQSADVTPSIPIQPTNVETSPDGLTLYVWRNANMPVAPGQTGVIAYNVQSTNTSECLGGKAILQLAVSPDPGSPVTAAIVLNDPSLYLVDDQLQASQVALNLPAGAKPVALAVAGDGDTLWVAVVDGAHALTLVTLKRDLGHSDATWNQAPNLPLYTASGSGPFLLRSTPDGSSLFLVDVAAATVRVVRAGGSGYALDPTVISGDVEALDVTVLPDGSAAFVLNSGTTANTITAINTATLHSRVAIVPGANISLMGLRSSPDGRRLFATDPNGAMLRILDPASLRVVQNVNLASTPAKATGARGLAVMPDGSAVWVAAMLSSNLACVEQIQMSAEVPRLEMVGDDGSSALFMRHALDNSPSSPTTGWSGSPDVIPYGTAIASDLTIFTTPQGYATDFVADVQMQKLNYVYVRGLNTTSQQITSRAYFFHTRGSLAMWPVNWNAKNVDVNGDTTRNWVDITAPPVSPTSNGVGVAQIPIHWTPDKLDPGADHYCVIAWVVNGPNPVAPDPGKYSGFNTFQDLVNFIMEHHDIAWRNTVDVLSQPPNASYETSLPIPQGGAQIYLTITFPNVPLDATFSVNLQGNTQSNTLSLQNASVGDYQGGYTPRQNPLIFPATEFETSLQVTLNQGPTKFPDTARIKVSMTVPVPPSLALKADRKARLLKQASPIRRIGDQQVFLVGSTQWNLLFNGPNGEAFKAETMLNERPESIGINAPASGFGLRPAWRMTNDDLVSPDVIVAPGAAAFDPSALADQSNWHWNFAQVPAIGKPNALYVRALNYTPDGSQTSTVSFFAVESDKLLDPTSWQPVGGAGKNSTPLSAQVLYEVGVPATPVPWTPLRSGHGGRKLGGDCVDR